MNFEEIKCILKRIFPTEHWRLTKCHSTFTVHYKEDPYRILIVIGDVYNSASIVYNQLMKLSELFGTTSLNIDNYSIKGCKSCDWGSDYGHVIEITNPTKNYSCIPNKETSLND